ncbi:MAG TPA: formate--tetrahydrofolate ligase [Longimicrobiales bacterium]|nr:formate--tetrahydrofolate ligase [Longimicrobiales bacterium]
MLSDIAIAQAAKPKHVRDIAAQLDLSEDDLELYGRYKAKVLLSSINKRAESGKRGRLVLVTGINPTPAGEGKSTLSVGLADGLSRRKQKVVLAIRQPSLGPVFGVKGGATGGGYAQVLPMEDINLHFTGDFHAISTAHALLSAMLDNHLQQGNALDIDVRRITWKRTVDMNDRALRNIIVGLGSTGDGIPRKDGFLITAASEVMAIFSLASDMVDLEDRLGRIVVGYTRDQKPVFCRDINAQGAMTLLLKNALAPNLVQTLEGTPAFIHAGPFGNIAHGCNSVIATKAGLTFGDVVVTEAGFGADLGAEKFLDIKCRAAGLEPGAAVVVATIRALKMHGGVAKADLGGENVDALKKGFTNLEKHIENLKKYGLPVIVAVNRFASDTQGEIDALLSACKALGVKASLAEVHAKGGEGALELADMVVDTLNNEKSNYKPLYPLNLGLAEKVNIVAKEIYGADGVDFSPGAQKDIQKLESMGLKEVPVCIAKTQYSFSDNPALLGRPTGFRINVREVTPSAGAGFVVVHTGDIMTMPGLPKKPAAENMKVHQDGTIEGLF